MIARCSSYPFAGQSWRATSSPQSLRDAPSNRSGYLRLHSRGCVYSSGISRVCRHGAPIEIVVYRQQSPCPAAEAVVGPAPAPSQGFFGGTSGPQHQALKHFPARKAAHREAAFACALGAHPPQSGCYAFAQRCMIGLPARAQEQILGSLQEDFAWYLFDRCHPPQGRLCRGGPADARCAGP